MQIACHFYENYQFKLSADPLRAAPGRPRPTVRRTGNHVSGPGAPRTRRGFPV